MVSMQVVWFKRDLRVLDHAALCQAAAQGPVCCLYVYEPCVLAADETSSAHYQFIDDCLAELDHALRQLGSQLCFRYGDIMSVLNALQQQEPITALWSHQETGLAVTYERDRKVEAWCQEQRIPWHQVLQHGVFRPLKSRDGWQKHWHALMNQQPLAAPTAIMSTPIDAGQRRAAADLDTTTNAISYPHRGGSEQGLQLLEDFLYQRGMNYQKAMSAPSSAENACSRLSPFISYGAISIRMIYHRCNQAKSRLSGQRDAESKLWRGSYASFSKRLRWHCHFMQKLEDEPDLEFHNMHRGFDGLRENNFSQSFFKAWTRGETGYPMVDACMRYVAQTGWLTFRMRAMVVSFASYHLWLHWRQTGIWLAQHFVDFEPGIHYSQLQMQSGVTGINAIRIYSPTKQALDHDPDGTFIKQWVPELADLPTEYLAEPWTMPLLLQQGYNCVIGEQYPHPLVDHKVATKTAKERIYTLKKQDHIKNEAKAVYQKHGSRRRIQRKKQSSSS